MSRKFVSLDLDDESTKPKEEIVEREPRYEKDIGYVLGWFCGGILGFAIIISLINLIKKYYRRAFQAIVPSLIIVAWLFIIMDGLRPLLPDTESGIVVWVLLLFGGIIFLPILSIFFLRKLTWPPRS